MIDTESKRRSVQAYTSGLMRPVPSGTIDTAARETAAWLYSGIPAAAPSGGGGVGNYLLYARRKGRR